MANLAALLEKEASAEIETILSEARQRASEIVAQARAEADASLSAQERSAQSQYEAALVRARSSAQLEAASLRLNRRYDAVENVLRAVRGKLEALAADDARYETVLSKLLKEAVAGMGGADAVQAVLVNPADRAVAERVAAAAGLAGKFETDESVRGGVRLRGANHVTLENTLYGRLDSLRDELSSEISRTLFARAP